MTQILQRASVLRGEMSSQLTAEITIGMRSTPPQRSTPEWHSCHLIWRWPRNHCCPRRNITDRAPTNRPLGTSFRKLGWTHFPDPWSPDPSTPPPAGPCHRCFRCIAATFCIRVSFARHDVTALFAARLKGPEYNRTSLKRNLYASNGTNMAIPYLYYSLKLLSKFIYLR